MINLHSIIYANLIICICMIYLIIPFLNTIKINNNSLDILIKYFQTNIFKYFVINLFILYLIISISEKLPSNIPIIYRRLLIIILLKLFIQIYINHSSYKINYLNYLNEFTINIGWFSVLFDIILFNIILKKIYYI